VCRRATGKTKRLAVDHDHDLGCGHDPKVGCRNCVRALACGPCNSKVLILHTDALRRAIDVRENAPAQQVLRSITKGGVQHGDQ
jgi:hypothetical protein